MGRHDQRFRAADSHRSIEDVGVGLVTIETIWGCLGFGLGFPGVAWHLDRISQCASIQKTDSFVIGSLRILGQGNADRLEFSQSTCSSNP